MTFFILREMDSKLITELAACPGHSAETLNGRFGATSEVGKSYVADRLRALAKVELVHTYREHMNAPIIYYPSVEGLKRIALDDEERERVRHIIRELPKHRPEQYRHNLFRAECRSIVFRLHDEGELRVKEAIQKDRDFPVKTEYFAPESEKMVKKSLNPDWYTLISRPAGSDVPGFWEFDRCTTNTVRKKLTKGGSVLRHLLEYASIAKKLERLQPLRVKDFSLYWVIAIEREQGLTEKERRRIGREERADNIRKLIKQRQDLTPLRKRIRFAFQDRLHYGRDIPFSDINQNPGSLLTKF
jgi:hypothetical protein